MTTHADTPAVPRCGWLVDLDATQLRGLVGAMVSVVSGAREAKGLVLDIDNGVMRLFRDDQDEPLEFPVNSTSYSRVPRTPMRPALARALAYQLAWEAQRRSLTNEAGDALNVKTYDRALSAYEEGLKDLYDDLVDEYALAVFQGPVSGQDINA